VTPELAIHVVRNFILPMFETEGKRILRNKSKNGRDIGKDLGIGGSSSVYNELKLSEMLSDQLTDIKARLQSSEETIEK
jgi:hypothetical protein